jgi:hypothetical protein
MLNIPATLLCAFLFTAMSYSQTVYETLTDEDMYVAQFIRYAQNYHKSYLDLLSASPSALVSLKSSPLLAKRFGAFKTNLLRIQSHQVRFENNEVTFTLGLNGKSPPPPF